MNKTSETNWRDISCNCISKMELDYFLLLATLVASCTALVVNDDYQESIAKLSETTTNEPSNGLPFYL